MKRGKKISMEYAVTPAAICAWAEAHPEERFNDTRFVHERKGMTANEEPEDSRYWWLYDQQKKYGWRKIWIHNGWEMAYDNGVYSCRKGTRKIFIMI